MAELTPDQQEALDALRPALPPIVDMGTDSYNLRHVAREGNLVAIDCEWNPDTGVLTTIGVGNEQVVVQIDWTTLNDLERVEVRADLESLVQHVPVVYHNAIADLKKLREHGFKVHPATHFQLDDTMLADAVLNSEEDHDLGDLNRRLGRLPDWKLLAKVAPREYNAADLVATVLIWKHGILPAFAKDPMAEAVYREQSLAFLAEIQVETEEAGIRVDKSKPYALFDKYDLKRQQATLMAQAYAGFPLNLRSPDDMKHVLYTVEQLPEQYEKGPAKADRKLTTDKDAIAALRRLHGTEWDPDEPPTLESAWANVDAGGHPLLEARYLMMGAQQAISHYIEPCMEFDGDKVVGVRDRIYPEIRQHVQASGRHSFVGPAVQQMKGDVLEQLTPDPGTCWVGWDWSQIEVRLLAYLADDQPYLDAFARGEDIHDRNKKTLFADHQPDLADTQRRFTKTFVFRLHYRGKPENAGDIPGARLLGLDRDRLVAIAERYMDEHPAIPVYWAKVEAQAETYRVVRTFTGRPRRLTSPYRAARVREACNHPLQGGVADIYAETALLVKRAAPWARFVYGAHDSQHWQVPVDRAVEFRAIVEPIVTREFEINGHAARFPASFKERQAA